MKERGIGVEESLRLGAARMLEEKIEERSRERGDEKINIREEVRREGKRKKSEENEKRKTGTWTRAGREPY